MPSSNDLIPSRVIPQNWSFVGWCFGVLLLLPLSAYLFQHVLQVNGVIIEAGFADLYGNEGSLVIAGGGDLPESIPNYFLNLAGGSKARLVVIPSYDATPNEEREIIREWRQRKVANVEVARCRARGDTASDLLVNKIRNATAVWFTGGQQKITAEYYPGTDVEAELQNLLERGGVIGGTSAGAAIMSRVMIEEGRREAKTSQGLDLFRGAVIDQHFMQRNRLTRLRGVLDRHPHIVGVGIDEGTALVVDASNGRVKVIGKSYVMLWAPSGAGAPHRAEFLKSGDTYDLDQLDWVNGPSEFVDPAVLELEPIPLDGES